MKLSSCLCFCVFILQLNLSYAQVDAPNENKVWYSLNLFKKINNRWSVDNLSLIGMRSFQHDFWFFQNDIGVNFNINRLLKISAGYGHTWYKYNPWWDRHYPQKPDFLNAVSFHSIVLGIQIKTEIGERFQLSNELIMRYYIPKFEKYETRFQYTIRLNYQKRNLPLGIKPFAQGAIYYYLNGVKAYNYDENYNVSSMVSPDGIHRFRGKVGINLLPAQARKNFSITLYYGINREFNLRGFGNDMNIEQPSFSGNGIMIKNPFNNYNILGLQFNYSL